MAQAQALPAARVILQARLREILQETLAMRGFWVQAEVSVFPEAAAVPSEAAAALVVQAG